MTGKGEKRFRFLKALLICLVLATAINGIPNLIQGPEWDPTFWPTEPSHLSTVATNVGISAISYWLIYLMFVGVAAAVRKLKGTDIGASDAASETVSDAASDEVSEGKTWKVMNLKKLNGWQRLGILLSATWLVVVVFGTITGYILPATRELNDQLEADKTEVNEFWVEATINVSFKPNPLIRVIPDVEATRRDYSDLDDVTFVEQWQESHPDVNFGQVNADYEDAIQHLHITYQKDRERIVPRASGYGFLFWAVPSVLVYVFAWGVGWVWSGFKLKGDG